MAYDIGAGDTRFWRDTVNPWSVTGKKTAVDRRIGENRDGTDNIMKAGFKLSKKQRKNYAKKAKQWEAKRQDRFSKIDQGYEAGLAKIKSGGMMKNGLPVDLVDGKARYSMDAIAQGLGVSDQERGMLDLWNKGKEGSGLDYKDWKKLESKVRGANTKNKSKYAIYNNFQNLDPVYAKVDLGKSDDMYHMSKMDFAKDHGSFYNLNMDKRIGDSIKPGWGEKYGAPIVKGLAMAGASMINPAFGAVFATAMGGVEAGEAGNFSWGNLAKQGAINAVSAYAGGQGIVKGALLKSALGAGIDVAEGDFDLKDTLTDTAVNVGTAAAMDLASGAVSGGVEGYQEGDTVAGIKSGLAGTELGGYAQDLGMIDAPIDSAAIDADLESAFGDVDDAELRLGSMDDPDYEGAGLIGPIDNTGIGFDDSDWSYGAPGADAQVEGAENFAMGGIGGQFDPRVGMGFDDSDWSYGMPSDSAQIEMAMNAGPDATFTMVNGEIIPSDGNIQPDEGMFGDADWTDALPFLMGLSPIIQGLLTSGQQRRGTSGGGETPDEGLNGFEDLYSEGAGTSDPYSQLQMFGAGIQ